MGQQATIIESVVQPTEWVGPVFDSPTTASSFATIAPTVTLPASHEANGVAIISPGKSVLKLAFFGTDAANEAFDVKIVAWSKIISGTTGEFIPTPLAHLTLTIGAATGAASGVVGGTSMLFVDTIASTYATDAINILSPGDDLPAMVELAHTGAQYIGLYFNRDTAASANAIYMNT